MDLKKLSSEAKIAGVCAGIAAHLGIEATYVRALFLVLLVIHGFGFIAYLIMWMAMDSE